MIYIDSFVQINKSKPIFIYPKSQLKPKIEILYHVNKALRSNY